jgi:histidinol-phosphate/aromatic aminotransferase/cobyric acid decarboxylase-like protein
MRVHDGSIPMTLTKSRPVPATRPGDAIALAETLARLRRARRHFRGAVAALLAAGAAAGAGPPK